MKIVQVIHTLATSYGGPARNSFELNITLNQLPGIEARLLYLNGDLEDSVMAGYNGAAGPLPVPRPSRVKLFGKSGSVGLLELIREVRAADVVVVHQYFLGWIAPLAVLATLCRTPIAVTPHGSLTLHQQKYSVWKKRAFELLFGWYVRKYIVGWVTGSSAESADLRSTFPGKPIITAGVGTTLPRFVAREGWNQPLRLLALSRIAPKKRHDLIISAIRQCLDNGLDVKLDVVGSGPSELEKRLQAQVDSLAIRDFVKFHGQKMGREKEEFFRSADIYLLPSDDENFGISLAEALAYGVPTIASSGVAAAQFMSAEAGIVLESPSPLAIAQAVRDLSRMPRRAVSESARACAETSFTWHAVALRWVNALAEMTTPRCSSGGDAPQSRPPQRVKSQPLPGGE